MTSPNETTCDDGASGAAWQLPAAITASFAMLYGLTASPHLLGGDAGLFATIFADGGTAHPPGYPLYSIYLRAWSWLPVASPAHGASLVTAMLGALSVGGLYLAARSWRLSIWSAAFGAVSFGIASHVWLFHTQPEVFALHHLVAAAILTVAAPEGPWSGRMRLLVLGILAGCGLSNHHTIVLLAPVGLDGVVRGLEESHQPLRDLLIGGLGLVAGLLPYGYLAWVAQTESGWHWGEADSWRALLHLFFREDYGTLRLTAGPSSYMPLEQIRFWATSVASDMLYIPVWAALIGLGTALVGARSSRGPLWIGVTIVLCGPAFATLLSREPRGIDYLLVRRFHLLSELMIGLLAAFGAEASRRYLRHARVRWGLIGAIAVAGGLAGWPEHEIHHAPTTEQYMREALRSLPERAVVVGTGDHHFFGMLYLQRALEIRRDVRYIDAQLLAHRWYRRRVRRDLELEWTTRDSTIHTDRLFESILQTGRPLFVTHLFHDSLLDRWPSAPFGATIRVYPRGTSPPSPRELADDYLSELGSLELKPRMAPPTSWAHYVLESYAARWYQLARALDRVGASHRAARIREVAHHLDPERPRRDDTHSN